MMYGYGYGPEYAFFPLMHILSWVFCIVLVIVVIRLIRGKSWRHHHEGWHAPWENRGLEILKERYAKGEINKEEFEAKKKDLMS